MLFILIKTVSSSNMTQNIIQKYNRKCNNFPLYTIAVGQDCILSF